MIIVKLTERERKEILSALALHRDTLAEMNFRELAAVESAIQKIRHAKKPNIR